MSHAEAETEAMSPQIPTLWRSLSMAGLLGLIGLIVVWNIWLTPAQVMPLAIELGLLLPPLLLLLPSLWRRSGRAYVLLILLSLLYLTLGVWFLMEPGEEKYGMGLLLFSSCAYLGSFMSARVLSRYNKALMTQQESEA